MNIGNYSFLSYNYSGASISSPLLDVIKYSRIIVLAIGTLVTLIMVKQDKRFVAFLFMNIDVIVFMILIYLGLLNALDIVNGYFYSLWQSFSLLCLLYALYWIGKTFEFKDGVIIICRIIFWTNSIVLPFLIIHLHSLGNEWSYNMAFSSKAFYPYCLLSMVLCIYACRRISNKSLFTGRKLRNLILEILVIILALYFSFMSARRTPLILILLVSFGNLYLISLRSMAHHLLLWISIVWIISTVLPKVVEYVETHSLELMMLKKLNDVNSTGGDLSEDNSYNERIRLWALYDQIAKRHPVVGVGAYNSTLYLERDYPNSDLAGYSPHNLYRGILTEHGRLGFFAFILMILRSLTITVKRLRFKLSSFYFCFFLLPVILINWNEYNLIPGQVFYWTTIIVILLPRMLLSRYVR